MCDMISKFSNTTLAIIIIIILVHVFLTHIWQRIEPVWVLLGSDELEGRLDTDGDMPMFRLYFWSVWPHNALVRNSQKIKAKD